MKRLFALALAWVSVAAFAQITYTDYSGSITTGGTSQTLAAASNGRVRIAILNPATETENLCVNLTTAASCTPGSSWILQSGQSIVIDSTETVTVVAATTGHKWIAKAGVGQGFAANGGGSGGGGGGAVTLASGAAAAGAFSAGAGVDGWDLTQGAKADAACGTDTGTCTVTSLLKRANQNLTTLAGSNAQLPTSLGQTTAAGSLSVVQASDQTSIVAQGSTTSGQKGSLTQGAVTTSSPTYTTGQTSPLSLDTTGALRVNVTAGSSSGTVTQGSTTSGQSGMLTQGAVTTAAPSYTNAQTSPISLTTGGSVRVADSAISATANADANRFPVSLDIASPVSGTANSAAVLTNMPFAVGKGAQSITVTVTSISSATVQFEYSPDGTDSYKTVNCWDATNTGSSGSVASSTTVRVVICPVLGTHFQVRQTTTGSSAATAIPNAAPSPKAIATVTVASSNQLPVLGASVHDSAIVGAPVRVGCRGRTSQYATTIANDDTVDVQCDLNGATITKPYSVSGSDWTTTVNLTDTTSTTLKAAAGAGIKNYVTWCTFSGIATTVATQIKILDNATLKYPFNMLAGGAALHVPFPTPIAGTANTAMNVQLSGSPTGAIDVTCGGYQGQ